MFPMYVVRHIPKVIHILINIYIYCKTTMGLFRYNCHFLYVLLICWTVRTMWMYSVWRGFIC